MATQPAATVNALPSSILHNGGGMRSQYTRAASRQVVQVIARKIRSWNRRAVEAATDMPQIQGGH